MEDGPSAGAPAPASPWATGYAEDAPAVWPTWTAAQATAHGTNSSSGSSPSESGDEAMAWAFASAADERDLEAFGGNGTPESHSAADSSPSAPAVGAEQQLEGARAGMQSVAAPMAQERGPSSDSVPDSLRPARDPAADPAVASLPPPPQQPPAVQPPPTGQPRRRPGGAVAIYAMPGVDSGTGIDGLPALMWEDVGQLLQGRGPLYTAAIEERPHVMTSFDSPRQLFLEDQVVRRKPGGDRWLNSGGKKGSIVHWIRPGFGVRKRYGKCVSMGSPEQQLRYAEFSLVTGTATAPTPETNKEHATVFVLERVREENVRPLNRKSYPASAKREAVASTQVPAHAHAVGGPAMFKQEVVSSPAIEPLSAGSGPRVFEGSRGTSAVVDIVQDFGSKLVSFQARQDSGMMIELGTIEKGGNGVTLSSTQGDFAEWHRRAPLDPALQEGDVVGFTNKGEITHQCSASGAMMLGVVSRKAIVEGSAPPEPERHMYDTVAYCGVVPVRVVHRSLGTALPAALVACTSQCKGESSAAARLFVCQLLQCALLRSLLIVALICMHCALVVHR
jgi:hypothetical protein